MHPHGATNTEKLVVSRHEIAELADTSLSIVDDAIRLGHLKSFLVGKKRKAKIGDVRGWIDFLARESDAGRPVCYRARNEERRATA